MSVLPPKTKKESEQQVFAVRFLVEILLLDKETEAFRIILLVL